MWIAKIIKKNCKTETLPITLENSAVKYKMKSTDIWIKKKIKEDGKTIKTTIFNYFIYKIVIPPEITYYSIAILSLSMYPLIIFLEPRPL